jgi:methionine biosynthesis protein MetW
MNFLELSAVRADLAFIAHWIGNRSNVLDLGCGDGVMLEYLQSDKQCIGYGIEIDDGKIPVCIERGVSVIQQDIQAGLAMFADNAFDTVLCLSALQMLKDVEGVLRDIARYLNRFHINGMTRPTCVAPRSRISRNLPTKWDSKCSNVSRCKMATLSPSCRTGVVVWPCSASESVCNSCQGKQGNR